MNDTIFMEEKYQVTSDTKGYRHKKLVSSWRANIQFDTITCILDSTKSNDVY